ncbi:hypothetical protein [Alicycliphilus denitrificans]|uniref:hypothetical protein n=1 Tax=Alicycliphilus denitrificans TaxID=179636 RepID=UPI001915C414|nr:hypothetical protein [Alicycliphilus denitrificans]MBN9572986.1 hypothetical protein [Alicycliphilus denitrificans]
MKKLFLHLLGCFVFVVCIDALAGGEDRRFESERLKMVQDIEIILHEEGICKNVAECQEGQFFFASPYSGGVSIEVWGGLKKTVIERIINTCTKLFVEKNGEIKIKFSAYIKSKTTSVKKIFGSEKPYMIIEFGG